MPNDFEDTSGFESAYGEAFARHEARRPPPAPPERGFEEVEGPEAFAGAVPWGAIAPEAVRAAGPAPPEPEVEPELLFGNGREAEADWAFPGPREHQIGPEIDEEAAPLSGLPNDRPAPRETRVFGNAPAGPLPPGQWGRPQLAGPYGGVVRPYGPQLGPRPSPGFPGAHGGEGPPSLDLEPWAPGGEFPATAAQLQLARVYQQGGEVPRHLYHQALRDKTAQLEGMPRDWRPGEAETNELRAMAENAHPGPNTRRRQALVEATLNDLLHGHGQMKRQVILNQMTGERSLKKVEAEAQKREQQQAQGYENKIDFLKRQVEEHKRQEQARSEERQRQEGERKEAKEQNDKAADRVRGGEGDVRRKVERMAPLVPERNLISEAEAALPKEQKDFLLAQRREEWVEGQLEGEMAKKWAATPEAKELRRPLEGLPTRDGAPVFDGVADRNLAEIARSLEGVLNPPVTHAEPGRFGVTKADARKWLEQVKGIARERLQKARRAGSGGDHVTYDPAQERPTIPPPPPIAGAPGGPQTTVGRGARAAAENLDATRRRGGFTLP